MTRVLLLNPPSPHPLGAPLLGQQYVAAALLAAGCEVRVIDAAANWFPHDTDWIVAEATAWAPNLIGFSLYTPGVRDAYALVPRFPRSALLVAGGPHATACPDETLRHGFDVAVIGEGEETIVRLLAVVRGETALHLVPGIRYRDAQGVPAGDLTTTPLRDLDTLPSPRLPRPCTTRAGIRRRGARRCPAAS